MRAPLSVIIPTKNAANIIGPTLASLFEGVQDSLLRELIISDGESTDEIAKVAEAAGATLVQSAPGRGQQLAAGADAASGSWLLFLHADTQLEAGWSEAARLHMDRGTGSAAYFRLKYRATGPWAAWVAGWANFRSRAFQLPYGDQGLLISRRLYEEVGGYPNYPLMEDVAIADRLKGRLVGLSSRAFTSPRKQEARGWLASGASNLLMLLKFKLGVPPDRLAAQYYRK